MHHNEIKDELCNLLSKDLVHLAICNEPIIYPCHLVVLTPAKVPDQVRCINSLFNDDRENILVCGFWAHRTDCIINVHVMNTDSKLQCHKALDKVLAQQE